MLKFSDYTSIFKTDYDYILHNTLNNALMRVHNESMKSRIDELVQMEQFDLSDLEIDNVLKAQDFILDENINEQNIVNLRYLQYSQKSLGIIMIPTRQCNFACPYCYEEHENKHMTDKVYEEALSTIVALNKKHHFSSIQIAWFGGEPMLAYEHIIEFMSKLRNSLDASTHLEGQMTTNGYLLQKEKFVNLVHHGVTSYQITVDGLADTHNKTRVPSNRKPTWDQIIGNLQDMKTTELDFSIMIRTNFTSEIIRDAEEWFDYVKKEFLHDQRYMFYFEAVKNIGGTNPQFVYNDGRESDAVDELLKLAKCKGIVPRAFNSRLNNFGMMCYAGKINNMVIDYDGTIRKCTVRLDDEKNAVGKIEASGGRIDEGKYSWWTSYDMDDDCRKCKVYPLCYGKKCPSTYKKGSYCKGIVSIYESTIRNQVFATEKTM